MKKDSIYNYSDCIKILVGEIKQYNKNKEQKFKKSKKNKKIEASSKMSKFINYIKSLNGTFISSKMNLLWQKNKLTKNFIKSLENYDYDDTIPLLIQLLCGNFSHSEKKFISNENSRPIIFYLLPINKKDYILFCICIRLDINNKSIGNEYIYFLDICEENKFKKLADDFIFKISSEKNILFDKIGIFSKNHNMFFEKVLKDENTNLEICFPFKQIELKFEIIFDKDIQDKAINDANDFKLNLLNSSVLEEMENCKIDDIILDMIENNEIFKLNLSEQEKKLVTSFNSTILSGRPGTGKTTVILIKLFIFYFDFIIKKCKREKNYIDYQYINENYIKIIDKNQDELKNKKELITKNLRIVFTSLSKYLCDEEQKIFGKFIYKSTEINFNFINKDEILEMSSFRDVKCYPLFINFRKLMFLIDGSLEFQFFHRLNLEKSLVKNLNDEIEYDNQTSYLCNNYEIFHSYPKTKENNISFFYSLPKIRYEMKGSKKNMIINLKEANEDTFKEFYELFIKENKNNELKNKLKNLKLKAIEIYSQLYSVIKGSLISHLFPNNCINKEDYKTRGKKLADLPDLDTIYDICMEYEDYKRKNKYFDMQDVVNHLIRQVKIEFKNDIKLIDYLFIDEIQDLTINQIYLLSLVSKNVPIYGGDTCQTISKINRFRFSDLKTIFYGFSKVIQNYKRVENAYVSLNFRLNSKILRLSNFISYLIREIFPNTLDKAQDDFSIKVTQFYPFFVEDITSIEKSLKKKEILTENDLNLYKYHYLIYRDDKEDKIKNSLKNKNFNCRTISECKGLENHFIIIYNFFTNSEFNKEWNIIFSNINEGWEQIHNINYLNLQQNLYQEKILELIQRLNISYNTDNENEIKGKILNEIQAYIYPKLICSLDKHKLFEFCSEIKQFYVSITRAQTFLMFYESEPDYYNKYYFYRYCAEKQLIADKRFINGNTIINEINDYFKKNKISVLSVEQFREDAIKEYYRNNYRNALYFFEQIGEKIWVKKCKIFLDHIKLKNLIGKNIKKNEDNDQKITDISENILKNIDELLRNGENEEEYFMVMAYCYKAQKKYQKAIEIYKKYNKFKECGIILYEISDYKNALNYFRLSEDDYYVIQCYYQLKEFENMFKYVNENYIRIKRYTFSKVYIDYSNDYLLLLLPDKNKIKSACLESYLNNSLKKRIFQFFKEYIEKINLFEEFQSSTNLYKINTIYQQNINNINNINIVKYAMKDLKLLDNQNDLVSNMINAYYFNIGASIFKEVIRLIPDIYLLKFNKQINSKIETKNIINILPKIYRNAELKLTEEEEFSIPLFVFNNYYKLIFKYNSNNKYFSKGDIFLFYLTINNEKKINEYLNYFNHDIPKNSIDYYNYYILRDISNLIIKKNYEYGYDNNEEELKNIEKMKISRKDKNNLINIFQGKNGLNYIIDVLPQLTKFFNKKEEFNDEKYYFDSMNITIMLIYEIILNETSYYNISSYLNEIFHRFYDFIFSIINMQTIWTEPNLKKLVIYLLTPLGFTPIPKESKLFKLYDNFPCFVLNKNNFIFIKEIKEKNLFDYKNLVYFESELNNYIISYDNAINLLKNLISELLLKIYFQNYDLIEYPIIYIMNDNVKSKYNKKRKKNMPLYFNLLFYISTINQKENDFDSKYISNVGKMMISIKSLINYKKNKILFDIDHYLLSLFYYDVSEKDLLLKTYLNYFQPKFSDKNFLAKIIPLCLLFAEKFKSYEYFKDTKIFSGIIGKELNDKVNIIKIFEFFSNKKGKKFYLEENNTIMEENDIFIKPSLLTSLILLKKGFPYVLLYMNQKYNANIKIYDFNNNLVDYESLYNIDEDEYLNYEEDIKDIKLEFINNYFKLLNYALDEIVSSSNKNSFVYDFSNEDEFKEISKDKNLKSIYDYNEYEIEKNENKKEKIKREILNNYFNQRFLNCFSRKNEWLFVKYLEKKFKTSLNKKNQKRKIQMVNDDEDDDDDYDYEFGYEKNKLKIPTNLDNKETTEQLDELIKRLLINWNFTFIEYNLFLIYITLDEFYNNIYLINDREDENSNKLNKINIKKLLYEFIREYESRDFFYLLKEFIFKYNSNEIKDKKHTFVWLSTLNEKIHYIEPEIEIELEKCYFENINESEIINKKEKNIVYFPTCGNKGIVYKDIRKEIISFIFGNYSDEEKYFNDYNYVFNHIQLY